MRENKKFVPQIVEERNQLANALNNKEPVIVLSGLLNEEFNKEIGKQIKGTSKLGKGAGKAGVVMAGIYLLAANIPGAIVLGGIGAVSLLVNSTEFDKYALAYLCQNEEYRIILVKRKGFSSSLDTIEGYEQYKFLLPNETKCPRCEKSLKYIAKYKKNGSNPCQCEKCGQDIIWTLNAREAVKANKKK